MDKKINNKPFYSHVWLGFAFSTGLMVSPETLTRIGLFVGGTGFPGLFLIFLFALFYISILLANQDQFSNNFQDQCKFAATFSFCVKLIALIFLATSLLATSGFVFNEIFLYWFPNFGFAFIVLGVLLSIQFLPQKTISLIQILLVSIPIIVLIVLITAAFLKGSTQSYISEYWTIGGGNIKYGKSIATPLLIFIGFDLGFNLFSQKKDTNSNSLKKGIFSAILFFGALFILWGLVSMHFIPKEKLLNTTIPHILAAKKILGDQGRFLMGLMVISGSMATINAIFLNITQFFLFNKTKADKNAKYGMIAVSISSIVIGLMMAGGLAGDDKIDLYVKGVLILWLFSYGINMVSGRFNKLSDLFIINKNTLRELILWISILILIITDKNFHSLVSFILPALIIISTVSVLIYLPNRHKQKF